MKKSSLISIIIPCYNGAAFIAEAIESVQAQSHKNWELIVIDDASTDGSINIVKEYCGDKRINILNNKINLGIAKTKNRGIAKSKGEFLAFLDQDDIWEDNKLELQAKRLDLDAAIGVVCSGMLFTDSNGNATTTFTGFEDKDPQQVIKNLYINPINSSSVMMIRRSCLDKIGVFDETLKGWDDYELLMRIGTKFRISYERSLLVKKRVHSGGSQHLPSVIAERERVFSDLFKMHPFLSEFKVKRDSMRLFNDSIDRIRSGQSKAARGFAQRALRLRPWSAFTWTLYLITLLPMPMASIVIKIIFSTIGKAKLIKNNH